VRSLLGYAPDELRRAFAAEGLEPYRAGQVLHWIYVRGERDFAQMSDLGAGLRRDLARGWQARALTRECERSSEDGTRKLVLRTADGGRIETVLIPEGRRRTVCVSSQVGCSLDCAFCATGRLGLLRNLRAEEIVDQVLHATESLACQGERPSHIVFMGMGEPLLNLPHVVRAIRILTAPGALGLAPRRITVSTAGVVPRMAELGRAVRTRLAVSLHATTDVLRDELVPLNRRFPIAQLLEACRAYPLGPRDRLSFEYTLIRGVNDSRADARRLVGLLHGMRAGVNLIPLNEHPGTPYRRPDEAAVDRFAAVLARARVPVAVRRSRGEDVLAACGQLGATAPPIPAKPASGSADR
jgi:23S rRNA (adenine2503-C2)-methyltransferase